jgi:hypothetical protein
MKGGQFPGGDSFDQIVVAITPQTTNDVVDGIAPRYTATRIVTLNFPLSNFALFRTTSTRTQATVLAKRSIEVI